MINKPLLVSSRFVCATVIQVNNRSRYAAVFTSLYVSNRKYYIAICEWWIDHQDVDGKHVDKLLFDQWPSTTTYWVSLSLGLQRWGKIFSELLLFTWFFAAITFRVELVKEWVVINQRNSLHLQICPIDLVGILPNDRDVIQKQL